MSEHAHGADRAFGQDFWDERYRSARKVWSGKPEPATGRRGCQKATWQGAGCGVRRGADAIWLARQRCTVVATDISGVALERAAQHACDTDPAAAARIEWRRVDLLAR